ncbi:flagellar hook-associated protein 2 [Virgibacillus litoralis]|uniref:Flagellar hook-associated protein 2 n=1 Tax=Virgibacillus litoralis TaxID=578221 RepID=A0ABS4HAP3_9BACI|nr:flagellar hook-associated protein 2 [Virgibacillus litoralis]MBP1947975.1 flagellar hook-associated protein 2 [Virgibacillus litoralis]
MRIGGLATGMDIDSLVNKLMKAERMPLDRMQQESTTLTWKRDAFRDINKKLLELDDMMLNMKLDRTYNAKSVSSSDEGAVTATASTGTDVGNYNIEVTQLAKSAINSSESSIGFDPEKTLTELEQNGTLTLTDAQKTFEFSTFDKDGENVHSYTFEADESLNDLLKRITNDDNDVRAFYDNNTDKVIMETTKTGNYNQDNSRYLGAEIGFNGSSEHYFLTDVLNIKNGEEVNPGEWKKVENGGTDAEFKYNGMTDIMTSHNNSYELNGVNFQFNGVGTANLSVTNNDEATFDSIMKFVDKYNEVVEELNGSQREEKFRDYKPLTDKQKESMSEDEIELWEEKAKSGILSGESAVSDGLFSMRSSWYSNVDTGGEITSLTQVGITTSSNFRDGGKLIVDPIELKAALNDNPEGVKKLFSNSSEDGSRGLINRLDDALDSTRDQIEARAGEGTDTLENYTIGKRMKDLNTRISDFEDRLVRVENRYWSQFTQMEKAIQRMNQQSAQLMSQFGGGA